ncbi:uncharacterized protein TRUGW13939_06528 [Talaromyces rugulosus]|uniref:Bud22 domain-containing protein n=1 Tax=Talaromyces rugulosus TaxID=121627 RepID=A0A7H8QZ25_TALRU|nr:uncharacterized protein TRUGW13939_06528 [Talaromyces rugulosus]QKX59394.1 hypothetical protein TRUGW13939_06528 [Talaromyces rugulosus]
MSKRKHSALEDDLRPEAANDFRATRLRHRFERGTQLLFRALKTARGFERQKLGRRQKTAGQEEDNKALERLGQEVQVLKSLNLEETAQRYLLKQLQKTKRIAESPEYVRLAKTASVSTSGPRDPAEANVTARLFKSNPVQSALPEILDGIRSLLGLDEDPKNQSTNKKSEKNEKVKEKKQTAQVQRPESVSDDELDENPKPNRGNVGDISNGEGSDAESLEFAQFDDRLASASDDSDSEMDLDTNPPNRPYDATADLSVSSGSESAASSKSPPASKIKGRQKLRADETPKDTTFLPSLMMGGYWSGTESGEDSDTPKGPPQRKNRMGQQARRALAEKKYGSGAKHLQNDNRNGNNGKNAGWDSRRGATNGSDSRPRWGKGQTGRPFDKGGNRDDRIDKPTQRAAPSNANAPLHPSWEAARKAKIEKSQASFQGKKITFD